VQFGGLIPGCDEPRDAASDDEEIQATQEELAELLHDIEE
jgi:hypothetical protein